MTVLLPLVPVIATIGAVEENRSQLDLAEDRDARIDRGPQQHRIARHARTRDHQVGPAEPCGIFRAEMDFAGGNRAARNVGAAIREDQRRAALSKEARGGLTRNSQPDHHHALSSKLDHRNLSVLSATSAQTIETIQKRITTTVSGHPPSSK